MRLLPSFKKRDFFTAEEKQRVIDAIRQVEQRTSGEIRIYVEGRCRFVDPLDRAAEIFWSLQMDHTDDHNAVLIYLAMKDHQMAIYADKGIHEKVGEIFWKKEVIAMSAHFREHHYADALLEVINDIGEALYIHFPFNRETDKNELPDDIVFGK
jgi:uncharacterized membrane protein